MNMCCVHLLVSCRGLPSGTHLARQVMGFGSKNYSDMKIGTEIMCSGDYISLLLTSS